MFTLYEMNEIVKLFPDLADVQGAAPPAGSVAAHPRGVHHPAAGLRLSRREGPRLCCPLSTVGYSLMGF